RWPERERRADIGEDLVDLVRKDILHRCSELRPLHLIAVTQVDARERAEHLAERVIAHCESVRRRLSLHPLHAGLARGSAGLCEQPRLADARLAEDRDDTARSGAHAIDRTHDGGALANTPDEVSFGGWAIEHRRADVAIRRERRGLSFRGDRIRELELERARGGLARALPDDDLARASRTLDALRRVHRIADNGVGRLRTGENARNDLAGVDSDAQRKFSPILCGQ